MSTDQKIKINTGGQWITSISFDKEIFCRERFSEEHNEIKKMVFQFAEDNILPKIYDIDKFDEALSKTLMREIGSLGLIGVDTPEQYGGSNLDKVAACIVTEGIGWGGSASFGCTFGVQTGIGSLGIVFFGTTAQKEKYLPKLMTGESIAAYGLTEPSAGSDALSAKTTAVLSDDGQHYILNGEKQFISNGGWADLYTILAQVDGDKFSGFIVERDTEGLILGHEEQKMGMKGSSTTSIKFTDAKVPAENLLYDVGKGAIIAFNALNIGRYKLGAASVGGSKQAIKQTLEYANERRQFGQPIAKFDSIIGKIADVTVKTYTADTMLYRTVGIIQDAIDELDKEDPDYYIKMGQAMEKFAIEASMAKIFGSETSSMVVDNCLQIFGGYGFIEEYPMAMAYRDDRINQIWEGTNEINRAIVTGYIMKKVLMEELSLRSLTDKIEDFTLNETLEANDPYARAKQAINGAKMLNVLIFEQALFTFGQDLKHEQQLSEYLADMFTLVYTSESVLSRTQQLSSKTTYLSIANDIASIHISESMLEIIKMSISCINYIFPEAVPTNILNHVESLRKILTLDTDIILKKQIVGKFMLNEKNYPF